MSGVRLGIRGKIAAIILICMVPVLFLGVVFYADRNRERQALVLRSQRDTAQALAADVETFITNAVHAERAAGAAVTSQPYPVIGIVQLFSAIRANDPAFLSLTLALPDGRVEVSDPSAPPRATVADRPAFARVLAGADWAVGPLGAVRGRPGLEVAVRIADRGRLAAVMDGIVDLTQLRTSLPSAFASDMDGVILDGAGRVVLDLRHPDRSAGVFRDLPAVHTALAGRPATITGFRNPRTGTRELGSAVPIPVLGWVTVVLEPETSALEPVRTAAAQEMLWVLAFAGLGLFLAWVLGGELSAPILYLARGARAIGRGDLGHRVALRRTDELGELGGAFDEMSERLQRSVSEMNALQAVSDAALSTVDLRELLPMLVRQIVSAMRGDGGAVWFADETTGDLAESNGGAPGDGRRLRPGEGVVGRVAAGGRPLVISDQDALRAVDPELPGQGVHSVVSVPLRAGGRVIGVILVFARRRREFRPQDVRLLETFADRVALAVDNARAFERQQEIAAIVQAALLPPPSVRLPGLAIAGRYRSSREVGGDFYAILPLTSGHVGLAIADVSGKGIPAATLSARTRYLLEAFALDAPSPDTVLARLNAVLARDGGTGMFVSLFYAVLDPETGTLRFSSAGHPSPLLLARDADAAAPLEARGLLLGVDADARYSMAESRIRPGDLLVLFTDGITEARDAAGEQFGEPRLQALLGTLRTAQPEDIADRVMAEVKQWTGDRQIDDQAFVAIRVLPWGANTLSG